MSALFHWCTPRSIGCLKGQPMRALALVLTMILLTTSCATVQHPATGPSVQYASIDDCRRQNSDAPLDCEKVIHQEGTSTAVKIGLVIVFVLLYAATLGLIAAGK
jgi:hypothetical protein